MLIWFSGQSCKVHSLAGELHLKFDGKQVTCLLRSHLRRSKWMISDISMKLSHIEMIQTDVSFRSGINSLLLYLWICSCAHSWNKSDCIIYHAHLCYYHHVDKEAVRLHVYRIASESCWLCLLTAGHLIKHAVCRENNQTKLLPGEGFQGALHNQAYGLALKGNQVL